jgi:hypothetical protein
MLSNHVWISLRILGTPAYTILHDDTSNRCRLVSWCCGFLCKDCSNQPKWWGKVKVELIAYIQICCYSKALFLYLFLCQQLQVEDYDLSYAGCSFQAILNQTMYALGFDWKYADEWPTLNTEGFQEKLIITKRWSSDPPASRSPLTVVSRPCARTFEARESAVLNALL